MFVICGNYMLLLPCTELNSYYRSTDEACRRGLVDAVTRKGTGRDSFYTLTV